MGTDTDWLRPQGWALKVWSLILRMIVRLSGAAYKLAVSPAAFLFPSCQYGGFCSSCDSDIFLDRLSPVMCSEMQGLFHKQVW